MPRPRPIRSPAPLSPTAAPQPAARRSTLTPGGPARPTPRRSPWHLRPRAARPQRRRGLRPGLALPALALVALAGGCAHGAATGADAAAAAPARPTQAVAVLKPAPGQHITGRAEFTLADDVVTLRLTLDHATPGLHAVHIHAVGDCSGAHFVAAGPHWNPTHDTHGRWGSAHYHLGDIGNVDVDSTGHGELVFATRRWQLGSGSADDVLGHAVVVHAGADDFTTQPGGNAGPRIACGVIHPEHGGM